MRDARLVAECTGTISIEHMHNRSEVSSPFVSGKSIEPAALASVPRWGYCKLEKHM